MSDKQETRSRRIRQIMDSRPAKKLEGRSRLVLRILNNAAAERKLAQQGGYSSAERIAEAERLEAVAATMMIPDGTPDVRSGEVAFGPGDSGPSRQIADTLARPDMAAIDASVARTGMLLTAHADVVALAVDAATTAGAINSNEKMLAHQLAIMHALTMKAATRALEYESRLDTGSDEEKRGNAIEFIRLAQTAGRLSSVFQDGLIAQQRVQSGGSQTMTVRHVTVEAGGQAVIGNVKGGGGPTDNPRRVKRK
jgi:hypothetical protein